MINLKYPDDGNIKLNYKTLYIGSGVTIVGVLIFIWAANQTAVKYEIRDILAMLTYGIVSTTLLYHAKNLKLNYDANQAKLEFDKSKFEEEKAIKLKEQKSNKIVYSFEATTLWFKPEMGKHVEVARKFLNTNKKELNSGPIEVFKHKLNESIETRMAVTCVLNYFENLSVMIKRDILDEETIKSCFKSVFVDYYKALKRYIDEIQKKSSRYLMNFEELAQKWEKS